MAVREFRIAQPKPKRVEGLSFEVSVSAVCHRVVFKRRELIDALIEGYRQSPARVIPAGQGLGDGASSFFARVPGVEDCVRMLCRPIHRKCAAVHEHNHKRLTRFAQSLQECFFFRGKIKVGAISALEAGMSTFISSPSSWEVIPTTATTASACFAAEIASATGSAT